MRSLDDVVRRNINELRRLWKTCSRDRSREALLPYLETVLDFYRKLRKRRESTKAGRRMASLYDFDLRDDMHTLRCIIEASSDAESQAKSRMTQALRYAIHQRWKTLTENVAQNGGIKGCADKFAKINEGARYSRSKRKPPGGLPDPLAQGGAPSIGAQNPDDVVLVEEHVGEMSIGVK